MASSNSAANQSVKSCAVSSTPFSDSSYAPHSVHFQAAILDALSGDAPEFAMRSTFVIDSPFASFIGDVSAWTFKNIAQLEKASRPD